MNSIFQINKKHSSIGKNRVTASFKNRLNNKRAEHILAKESYPKTKTHSPVFILSNKKNLSKFFSS